MKRYRVSLRAVVTRDVEVEAESPQEAVKTVKERHDSLDDLDPDAARGVLLAPDSVEEILAPDEGFDSIGELWDVIGSCEACSCPLLDSGDLDDEPPHVCAGDEDGDGVYLCRPCADKSVEESGSDKDPVMPGGAS